MRAAALLGCVLLSACAGGPSQASRPPFSVAALFADAPGYLRSHYRSEELPTALTADLAAAGFRCLAAPNANICERDHAHASPPQPPCYYTYSDVVFYCPNGRIAAIWDAPRCNTRSPESR